MEVVPNAMSPNRLSSNYPSFLPESFLDWTIRSALIAPLPPRKITHRLSPIGRRIVSLHDGMLSRKRVKAELRAQKESLVRLRPSLRRRSPIAVWAHWFVLRPSDCNPQEISPLRRGDVPLCRVHLHLPVLQDGLVLVPYQSAQDLDLPRRSYVFLLSPSMPAVPQMEPS